MVLENGPNQLKYPEYDTLPHEKLLFRIISMWSALSFDININRETAEPTLR